MHRLATLGVSVLVVGQYESAAWCHGEMHLAEERRQTLKVLGCAAAAGLATLDTFELVDHAVRRDGLRAVYLDSHHTPSGNRLVERSIVSTDWLATLSPHQHSRAMRVP